MSRIAQVPGGRSWGRRLCCPVSSRPESVLPSPRMSLPLPPAPPPYLPITLRLLIVSISLVGSFQASVAFFVSPPPQGHNALLGGLVSFRKQKQSLELRSREWGLGPLSGTSFPEISTFPTFFHWSGLSINIPFTEASSTNPSDHLLHAVLLLCLPRDPRSPADTVGLRVRKLVVRARHEQGRRPESTGVSLSQCWTSRARNSVEQVRASSGDAGPARNLATWAALTS